MVARKFIPRDSLVAFGGDASLPLVREISVELWQGDVNLFCAPQLLFFIHLQRCPMAILTVLDLPARCPDQQLLELG